MKGTKPLQLGVLQNEDCSAPTFYLPPPEKGRLIAWKRRKAPELWETSAARALFVIHILILQRAQKEPTA